ncbi:MAG TPA: hypothetical protein VME18_03855 [Acidobacteriaceae bacterium]|nr:hypothetical protein [Acidobacteriaceae bacterium]
MTHLQGTLVSLEPVLVLLAGIAFFKCGAARRLPALATYFVVRGISVLLLFALLWNGTPTDPSFRYTLYFYCYWVTYIACAVILFFVVQEVFVRVMEPVPGLRRLGLLAFRWGSIVTVVVAIGAVALPASVAAPHGDRMGPIALQLARCVSVMEICLLAFLALSIHALGRSFRSRLFGIGMGFGIQSAAELIVSGLLTGSHSALHSSAEVFLQCATTVVLLTWTVYFLLPEPQVDRDRVVLAPTSAMARWNSLANGLSQMPQVAAAAQPSTGFFLQDIEGVVERVLAKNPVVSAR